MTSHSIAILKEAMLLPNITTPQVLTKKLKCMDRNEYWRVRYQNNREKVLAKRKADYAAGRLEGR